MGRGFKISEDYDGFENGYSGKVKTMRLTIRVILSILFSAFALWAQAPGADSDLFSMDAELAQWRHPVFSLSDKLTAPGKEAQFSFKLNLPERSSEVKEYVFADKAVFPSMPQAAASQAPPARPKSFSYSHGYFVRRKIHKYASLATLPLIVSEAVVGEKLMDRTGDDSDSLRSTHSALAAGMGVLFGVESVTGIWNMLEARKNPNRHRKHLLHGILMLAADAGFVATAALAPGGDDDEGRVSRSSSRASAHRAAAYTSLGIAAFSYVYALIH
jgi:hypothetical protein